MGFWIWYLLISVSLAWTSYFRIFRPALDLLEEILEQKTVYRGAFGFLTWTVLAALGAPMTLYILLTVDNGPIITHIATELADRELDE